VRIESSGNLTIDHIRHHREGVPELMAFAPESLRVAPGAGHACRCEEPRGVEEVCDAEVDRIACDDRGGGGWTGPTPGEGLGVGDAGAGCADMGTGAMLDVFA